MVVNIERLKNMMVRDVVSLNKSLSFFSLFNFNLAVTKKLLRRRKFSVVIIERAKEYDGERFAKLKHESQSLFNFVSVLLVV